jgi:hypothetical protein
MEKQDSPTAGEGVRITVLEMEEGLSQSPQKQSLVKRIAKILWITCGRQEEKYGLSPWYSLVRNFLCILTIATILAVGAAM